MGPLTGRGRLPPGLNSRPNASATLSRLSEHSHRAVKLAAWPQSC